MTNTHHRARTCRCGPRGRRPGRHPYELVRGCRDGGDTDTNYLGRALMRVRDELRATP